MILKGAHGEQYTTGREIGRGGEGQVFEVREQSSVVLKKYNEPPSAAQVSKLARMVAMGSAAIEAYAAWPAGLVMDGQGSVCGFLMKKLNGYVPLHMIFSPMDRKKLFPDKGYNFLVHIARNLATAFHKLHEAGLVVGDVNEGNILINAAGMVSFIDCDSFQVKDGSRTFYCEVGVPRYTPPELLVKGTFENEERNPTSDSFSMAVLLFQLLFMGRHPFAGRNTSTADIDEETAIKMREFAYSIHNRKKKLFPPKDSFDITSLPEQVVLFFHRAFEQDTRPLPAEWVAELDMLLRDMVTCATSRLHTYPGKLKECPWCLFKNTRGILYFLDDNYLKANTILSDIDSFVNGFKLEELKPKPWKGNLVFHHLAPKAVNAALKRRKMIGRLFLVGNVAFIAGSVFLDFPITDVFLFILFFWGLNILFIAFLVNRPQKAQLKLLQSEYLQNKEKLRKLIYEFDNAPDLVTYTKNLHELEGLVHEFRRLPGVLDARRVQEEEKLYNEQLSYFLACFNIDDFEIPSIGAGRKAALHQNGIHTAADITQVATLKIAGIGSKNQQVLIGWQRQMSSGFVYIPDNDRIAKALKKVTTEVSHLKLKLESDIRKQYQSVNYIKLNITNRSAVLERQINDFAIKTYQAEINYSAFRRFATFI
ncbi:MAG: hypothetical protein H7257_14790 [Taibaiella sp.]|nr:hypothetical protein [Taibaiella sp.]